MKIKQVVVIGLLLVGLVSVSCGSSLKFNNRLNSMVKPYHFSVVAWQLRAVVQQVSQLIWNREKNIGGGEDEVIEYFALAKRITALESQVKASGNGSVSGDLASTESELEKLQEQRAALVGKVERIIKQQIKETLSDQGIFHPLDRYIRLKVNFPPPNFKLEEPPHMLAISPRERIEMIKTVLLRSDIGLPEMEGIESEVDGLGVSSLVMKLGGLGATYPTLVTTGASLRFVLNTATHEWVHQYLSFKPLGFRYLLDLVGVSPNYEIAVMNETLAGIVAGEISDSAREQYYPDYDNSSRQKETGDPEFDFAREMREIRKTVDRYLAQGEIEAAETFMEEKRQFLATKGYYIRKLNQAYFAFHGKYADRPAFISPIGLELKQLRAQSASLKDFLDRVAAMSGRHDLKMALAETPPQ